MHPAVRLLLLCLLALAASAGRTQPVADSLAALPDSLVAADTGAVPAPTLPPGVVPAPPAEGGLEEPVQYAARDSLRLVLAPRDSTADSSDVRPDDRATLWGRVTVRYGEATLQAGQIELAFGPEELRAVPRGDSLGTPVEPPTFAEGEERFEGREFVYNLRSRRGRVVGARTAVEAGFLLGGVIKQRDEHVIYAQDAAYTTCELDHPHYAVEAGRMKIVDGERVFTGPVRLVLLGIPTPIILPFGFFPAAEGRRSGPLAVTYGEDQPFGFYLDNVGWYWAASDYFDLLGKARVGTRGSFQIEGRTNYVRRYGVDGALTLTYGRLRTGERTDPDFTVSQSARIGWRHQQPLGPDASLSANVDLTSSATRQISDDLNDRVAQTSTSAVGFRRNWPRHGRSLSLDLRATQQIQTGGINATAPSLSFSQRPLFPFRRGRAASSAGATNQRWLDRISIGLNSTASNQYDFQPDTARAGFEEASWIEALFSYDSFVKATGDSVRFRPEARHDVPLTLSSFTVERLPPLGPLRLNVNPSVRYSESWLAQSDRFVVEDSVARRTEERGFTAIRRVALTLAANTEAYGQFPLRIGPLDGLRHVVRPQVNFSFEPDYGAAPFNYVRTYTDPRTNQEVPYPIVSGIPIRPTARLGFSVGNVFQARRVREDSTGEETRTVVQLLSLNLASGYDFAAPERPLSDLSLDASSEFGEAFRFRLDAGFSPYALDSLGVITPETYLREAGFPLRPTRLSFSAGTAFRSRARGGRPSALPPGQGTADAPLGLPGAPGTLDDPTGFGAAPFGTRTTGVVDFAVPWSFDLDLTFRLTPAAGPRAAQREAVLSVSRFDFSLTPNWKVAGSTGFDLARGEIATTQLAVVRDLHCWEMRFNWVPFGDFRSFSFALYVKSGYLRDFLRLDFPRSSTGSQLNGLF